MTLILREGLQIIQIIFQVKLFYKMEKEDLIISPQLVGINTALLAHPAFLILGLLILATQLMVVPPRLSFLVKHHKTPMVLEIQYLW